MSRVAPASIVGKIVGPVGFGLMGFSRPWAPIDYSVATKVMKTALEQGANYWNGGLHYGTPTANSLHLLKHYFITYPEDRGKVILSIKGAYNATTHEPDCSPEGIQKSIETALSILDGTKKIDIFECARVDPNVSIETSIATLAEFVKDGKIGGIGISEASEATVRRAHKVHPIAAAEIELSLFTTDALTNGVVSACHDCISPCSPLKKRALPIIMVTVGIAIIAYSPLGRGWLTGELRQYSDLAETDMRRMLPRFQPDVFDNNVKLVDEVDVIAKRKGVTLAQVAIAWVRAQGAIPIPGATTEERVLENFRDVELTGEELVEIQVALDRLPVQGERYGGRHEKLLNL